MGSVSTCPKHKTWYPAMKNINGHVLGSKTFSILRLVLCVSGNMENKKNYTLQYTTIRHQTNKKHNYYSRFF